MFHFPALHVQDLPISCTIKHKKIGYTRISKWQCLICGIMQKDGFITWKTFYASMILRSVLFCLQVPDEHWLGGQTHLLHIHMTWVGWRNEWWTLLHSLINPTNTERLVCLTADDIADDNEIHNHGTLNSYMLCTCCYILSPVGTNHSVYLMFISLPAFSCSLMP